jgi:hypothetical protein
MLGLADVIITGLQTIMHFLGIGVPDQILGKETALETAKLLESEFKGKAFLLRFGIGHGDESLICLPGITPQHRFTGYRLAKDLYGFGDKLSARELAEILPILRTG